MDSETERKVGFFNRIKSSAAEIFATHVVQRGYPGGRGEFENRCVPRVEDLEFDKNYSQSPRGKLEGSNFDRG